MTQPHLQQLPAALSTVSSGETILIHPSSGRFYSLSPTASVAWSALAQPRTAEEVIDIVCSYHDGAPSTAADDVTALLAELQAEGLLIPAAGAPASPFPPPASLAAYAQPLLHRGSLSHAANGVSGVDDGQTGGLGTTLLS
jgi:hypothetical protein